MPPSRSGWRSGSRASWSWMRLLEGGGLADEPAEPRVNNVELEQKAAVAELGVRNGECAGRRPCGQPQAKAAELHEIVRGTEDKGSRFDMDRERHADAKADVLLEPGRTREALRRMDDLRKAAPARIEPRPVLPVRRHVFGDGDDARNMRIARERQRAADQP